MQQQDRGAAAGLGGSSRGVFFKITKNRCANLTKKLSHKIFHFFYRSLFITYIERKCTNNEKEYVILCSCKE